MFTEVSTSTDWSGKLIKDFYIIDWCLNTVNVKMYIHVQVLVWMIVFLLYNFLNCLSCTIYNYSYIITHINISENEWNCADNCRIFKLAQFAEISRWPDFTSELQCTANSALYACCLNMIYSSNLLQLFAWSRNIQSEYISCSQNLMLL